AVGRECTRRMPFQKMAFSTGWSSLPFGAWATHRHNGLDDTPLEICQLLAHVQAPMLGSLNHRTQICTRRSLWENHHLIQVADVGVRRPQQVSLSSLDQIVIS